MNRNRTLAATAATIACTVLLTTDTVSAHSNASNATCDRLQALAQSYELGDTNHITVTLAGVVLVDVADFGTDYYQQWPVPQGGAMTSWSVVIDSSDDVWDSTASGVVGPCGTTTIPPTTILVTTTTAQETTTSLPATTSTSIPSSEPSSSTSTPTTTTASSLPSTTTTAPLPTTTPATEPPSSPPQTSSPPSSAPTTPPPTSTPSSPSTSAPTPCTPSTATTIDDTTVTSLPGTPSSPPCGRLPATGTSDALPVAAIALTTLLLGAALITAARR